MSREHPVCPVCDQSCLVESSYTGQLEYAGQFLEVPDLECWQCRECGADPVFRDQARRNHRRYQDARRQADGLLTGADIAAIRKRLNLTQQQTSRIFGGGKNAFSKYERGDVIQSVAMDRLMRLIARFPQLLPVLALDAGVSFSRDYGTESYKPETRLSLNDPEFRSREVAKSSDVLDEPVWKKSA